MTASSLPFKENNPVFDVVVVGAGPAGCFFSKLAGGDLRVLLVDRGGFPRAKPCGGLLVEESKNMVRKLGVPSKVLVTPFQAGLRHVDFNNGFDFMQGDRGLVNVSRVEFDAWLHESSREASAVALNCKVEKISRVENGSEVFLKHKSGKGYKVFSKFVVGADGASSMVRPLVTQIPLTKYVAVQEIGVSKSAVEDVVFVYDDEITDYYSWIIPKNGKVIIGSALNFGKQDNFACLAAKLKKRGFNWKRTRLEAALLSRPASIKEIALGKGGLFLAGEASGLISPSTGEGISFALRSALSLSKAFKKNPENPIEEYEKLCAPLVSEVAVKIDKARLLSSALSRKLVFGVLSSSFEPVAVGK